MHRPRRARRRGIPRRPSPGHVPDAPGAGPSPARGQPALRTGLMADQTAPPDARPFPPGEYPIVIVGSGPGALQVAYFLGRLGIEHAVISSDPGPGGMF